MVLPVMVNQRDFGNILVQDTVSGLMNWFAVIAKHTFTKVLQCNTYCYLIFHFQNPSQLKRVCIKKLQKSDTKQKLNVTILAPL